METTNRPGWLLDYHQHYEWGRTESVGLTLEDGLVVLSGAVHDPTANVSEGTNEYNWAWVKVDPFKLVEGLALVQEGRQWSFEQATIGADFIDVGQDDSHSPGAARATLSTRRRDLLLLDAYEVAFSAEWQARTGTIMPAGELDRAFIGTLRRQPERLAALEKVGFQRTVLALLNEANATAVKLDQLGDDGGLWLVRPAGGEAAAMLLSIDPHADGSVGIEVVDRINGIRDRSLVSKAAIVTRSTFRSDVHRAYGALTRRMELVDYDRLAGMLADAGWVCRTPGYLVCPTRQRPDHRVFISYSWEQCEFAVWLYNQLHGWQYDCFLDRVDLSPGDVILSAVKQALDGVDAVILCCSEAALSSRWVQAEIDYCLERERRTGRRLLIPALLPGTEMRDVQRALGEDRLVADFRGWRPAVREHGPLEQLREAVERLWAPGRPEG